MVFKSTRPRAYLMAFSQQLLVLAAVGAALIPAAAVLNLDVVSQSPAAQTGSASVGAPATSLSTTANSSQAPQASVVPVGTVKVIGHDVALTSATTSAPVKIDVSQVTARTVVSNVTPVTGYGIVGLSWAHGDGLSKADVAAQIRTETAGVWSGWEALDYADNGPDANSPDANRGRPGTEETLVGRVNFVQARLTVTSGSLPTDLKLAVIDTGTPANTAVQAPAIDTARLDPHSKTPDAMLPAAPHHSGQAQGSIAPAATTYALASGSVTSKPVIYSRGQWGADESWRDPTSLHYFEIHGGFVHHTVNSNDYTAADVPAIIRGIYYFHTHSRGWSDIGYNFLIDKFGRIWEGRYGGVDRAVVGAHAYGVNDYAFGVSAIGNYNLAQPSQALVNAEGALFAWKLSLSGISASAKSANIAGVVFNSPIQGHRDAAKVNSMNQTECPGTYLYAKIPTIRAIAAADQAGWAERNLHTSIVGKYPSIVARRASDSQVVVLPTGGLSDFSKPVKVAALKPGQSAIPTPDISGGGMADLVITGPTGGVMGGHNNGYFAPLSHPTTAFAGVSDITAVGDVNGDHHNDLMGIDASGHAVLFNGADTGGFGKHTLSLVVGHPRFFLGAGALTSDGKPDLLAIDSNGVMKRFHGNGAGAFAAGVTVPGSYPGGIAWSGIGDFTGDGKPDIVEQGTSGAGYVWPGNGAGGFSHWVGPYGATNSIGTMTGAAVLSGHTHPDLIGTHDGGVYMAANNGRTDLDAPIATGIFLPNANLLLNVGDWDGDGYGDFMARLTNGQLYLYRGKGNGQFYPAKLMTSGAGSWTNVAAPGDLTGDGHPDLQFQSGKSLMIAPGAGSVAGFAKAYVSHAAIAGTQIAAGLWDGDGAPDSIFRSGNTLTLWLGDGPGGLYAAKSLSLNVSGYNWIAGEAPGRGGTHPDLFARETASGALVQRTGTNLNQFRYMGGGLNAYNLLG